MPFASIGVPILELRRCYMQVNLNQTVLKIMRLFKIVNHRNQTEIETQRYFKDIGSIRQ